MAVASAVADTGNPLIDSLTWGTRWSSGAAKTVVNVGFVPGAGGTPTAAELAAIMGMFDQFEAVLNVDLRWTGADTGNSADIRFLFRNDTASAFMASGEPPGEGGLKADGSASSIITISRPYLKEPSNPVWEQGSFNAMIMAHEFGHALGLAHPHDDGGTAGDHSLMFPGVKGSVTALGAYQLNQGINTMMSYNYGWATGPVPTHSSRYGYTSGPMALDIQALQYLYGANASHNAGNTLHVLPNKNVVGTAYACLWDSGGFDTIAAPEGSTANGRIDLRAATGTVDAGGGGYVSHLNGVAGGFTIAKGVVIERAIGGLGNDVLIGNGAANVLAGQGGIDRLYGGRGRDVFDFNRLGDSAAGLNAPDRIADFHPGEDRLDLQTIDANNLVIGNQAFVLWSGDRFTAAGQVKVTHTAGNTYVQLNTDRDVAAESVIQLVGWQVLGRGDFLF
jgi:serralysin